MHSSEREIIKNLVSKVFTFYGQQSQIERSQILLDMLCDSGVNPVEIAKALKAHMQESNFLPTLADVLTRCSKPQEADFLARFRRQALSVYRENVVDDDVYTVKEILGRSRCENCLTKDLQWLEKDALERFRDLKAGLVPQKQNPALDRVVKIGHAGSYKVLPVSQKNDSLTDIVAQVVPSIKSHTQIASRVYLQAKKIDRTLTFDYCCQCLDEYSHEFYAAWFDFALKEKGETLGFIVQNFTSLVLDQRIGGSHFYNSESDSYQQYGVAS